MAVNVALIAPRAFVFVEPRRFLQPVRPATAVVNNTTIINNTVNITNIKVVNNTVINEGPRTQIIEQASGQQVRAVPVRELRHKQEAEVVTRQRIASPGRENNERNVQSPIRSDTPRETKAQQHAREAEASAREQSQQNARDAERAAQVESQRQAREAGAKAQEESQRHALGLEKKAQQEAERHAREAEASAQEQSQRNAREAERAAQVESQRQAREAGAKGHGKSELRPKYEPITSEADETNTVKKAQKKRGKEKPSAPVFQPVTP